MDAFPAAEFRLDGEPAAIRASAGQWSAFGAAATEAAAQIRSLDSSLFIGPEGDQYRAGLNRDLPPHLDTTGRAYTAVGTTLTTYATTLSGLQDRMTPLRVKAPALWEAMQQACGRVTATANLSAAEKAWNECLTAARAVTADLRTAVDRATKSIRDAADLRFAHNPHGLPALVSDFKTFVTDHAKGLSQLSGALKVVSGIASVLTLIPVIGEVALAVSLVTAGAALLIDASIKYSTGKGSWASIAIDGGLLALPFGIGKAADAYRGARAAQQLTQAGAFAARSAEIVKTAQIGTKLEYFLGNATGTAHNIERSTSMELQLNSVGIFDNAAGRSLLEGHLRSVFGDSSSIVRTQENGRVVREGILVGPHGILKTETIWDGDRLITGTLYGKK